MLRAAPRTEFEESRSLLGRHYRLRAGRRIAEPALSRRSWLRLTEHATREPVLVAELEGRRYWLFGESFYWEAEGLETADVQALLHEREGRKRRHLERAHGALQREETGEPGSALAGRPPIPREVRLAVYRRDGGRCVECNAVALLQYDHVIPLALGGSNSESNLQLLCDVCNRRKGASLG